MQITVSLQELVLLVLGILGIVLLVYLIGLTRNLIKTANHTNRILEDAEVISRIAAEKTQALDGTLDDVIESAATISEMIKNNQSPVKAATNLVNSLAALKNLVKGKEQTKK